VGRVRNAEVAVFRVGAKAVGFEILVAVMADRDALFRTRGLCPWRRARPRRGRRRAPALRCANWSAWASMRSAAAVRTFAFGHTRNAISGAHGARQSTRNVRRDVEVVPESGTRCVASRRVNAVARAQAPYVVARPQILGKQRRSKIVS